VDWDNFTVDDAEAIYRDQYWNRAGCDNLAYPLCVIVFDTAVNMGVSFALQLKSLSTGSVDYLFNRIQEYRRKKNFNLYGKGWIGRVLDLYTTFLKEV
jgi:lysozyme family protein